MNFRWTDTLIEPLATLAGDRDWDRVEEARVGGWLLLSAENATDLDWYHAAQGAVKLEPLTPFADAGFPAVRKVVSNWLKLGHRVQFLAWRVGRRAVFRLSTPEGERVCKLYNKDRQIPERWAILNKYSGDSWRVPRVLEKGSE